MRMQTKAGGGRVFAYDALRVASIFTVAYSHLIRYLCNDAPMGSLNWAAGIVFKSLSIFCVPALFMISGSLFLDARRKQPLKKLYGKNILRLATAYVFWSFLYGLMNLLLEGYPLGAGFAFELLRQTVIGRYHMWFLLVTIGLYMLTPFLRKICLDRRTQEYFLVLWALFELLPEMLSHLFPNFENVFFWLGKDKLQLNLVFGYAGYFILGHYLTTYELSRRARRASYALAALAVVYEIAYSWGYSYLMGWTLEPPRSILSLEVALCGVGVFVFCQRHLRAWPRSARVSAAFARLSALSFGTYLVHDVFITLMTSSPALLATMRACTPLWVPLGGAVVFALSTMVVALLQKIPRLNRYIL